MHSLERRPTAHSPCVRTGGGRVLVPVIVVLLAATGCERKVPTSSYMVLTGSVDSVRADASQFVLRPDEPAIAAGEPTRVTCFLPSDAEVYVDDRLAASEELRAGDRVELLGYADANPRNERFVVSFANIQRGAVDRERSPAAQPLPVPAGHAEK